MNSEYQTPHPDPHIMPEFSITFFSNKNDKNPILFYLIKHLMNLGNILSQSSNATSFYFDNIFFLTKALSRLVCLNESSFS